VILALLAGLFIVPESRDPDPPGIDLPGTALSITTLTTLVYAIIEAPSRGWTDSLVLAAFAGSMILGTGFLLWEKHTQNPMLDLSFFRNPRFSAGVGAITMAFFALFGMIFITSQYLQFVHGYSALQAGIRIMPFALGMMVGAANSYRLVAQIR